VEQQPGHRQPNSPNHSPRRIRQHARAAANSSLARGGLLPLRRPVTFAASAPMALPHVRDQREGSDDAAIRKLVNEGSP